MTSTASESHTPKHVAIIMDGNNRFAKKNNLHKGEGHFRGRQVLDPILQHCLKRDIQALTVFAFSSENWNRPPNEVELLMKLLEMTIHEQIPRMIENNIALRFIGDRSKLSDDLKSLLQEAEEKTKLHTRMTLSIAFSYGGMWDMTQAAKQIALDVVAQKIQIEQIDEQLFGQYISLSDLPPVDLLIRTGGDYRLSNFLLWQAAYAELYFTATLWPEFTTDELDQAIAIFASRERRFGKTSEQILASNT